MGRIPMAPGAPNSSTLPLPLSSTWAARNTLFPANNSLRAGNAVPLAAEPEYSAYDGVTNLLYVSGGGDDILEVDPSQFTPLGELNVSAPAGDLLYDPGTGQLLVESQGSVLVVDPGSGTLTYSINVTTASAGEDGTMALDPAQDTIWVTNPFASNVSVVDLGSRSVVATLPIGEGFNDIVAGVFDPVNDRVYLAYYENATVEIFNADTFTRLGNVNLSAHCCFVYGLGLDPVSGNLFVTEGLVGYIADLIEVSGANQSVLGAVGVGGYPSNAVYDARTGDLYVADASRSRLSIVDPSNLSVLGRVVFAQDNPLLAGQLLPTDVSALGLIYVATYYGDSLDSVAVVNPFATDTIHFGSRPTVSVYDPACACDAVADSGRDVLYFIDPQTLTVNASVPLGGDPYGIAFANSTAELWVTLGGLFGPSGVEVLNASSGSVVAILGDNELPWGLAYDSIGNSVYVANFFGNDVYVYNASSLARLGTIPTGSLPIGVAWDATADRIYVANEGSNNISVLNGSSGVTEATIGGIASPSALGVEPVSQLLFVGGSQDQVPIINTTSDSVIENLSLLDATGFAFDPAGGVAFVMQDGPSIAIVNASGLTLSRVEAGAGTYSGAFVPSYGLLANDPESGAVVLVSTSSSSLIANVSLVASPEVVALNGELNFSASFVGGTPPFSYSYTGLPAGCGTTNGTSITCTPTSPGTFEVGLTIEDAEGQNSETNAGVWVLNSFPIDVQETGLPAGSSWSFAVLGGANLTTSGTLLSLNLTNGTYGYSASTDAVGFVAVPAVAAFSVAGESLNLTVAFFPPFSVKFIEQGLWEPAQWSLAINGELITSDTNTVVVALASGTYRYSVSPIANYSVGKGIVSVQGNLTMAPVSIYRIDFFVVFTQTGLPAGAVWDLRFNGHSSLLTNTSMTFLEPNGTDRYIVTGPSGFIVERSSKPAAAVTVAATNASIPFEFSAGRTFSLTLEERGLVVGTTWCGYVGSGTCTSAASFVVLNLSPGTYPFNVSGVFGYNPLAEWGNVTIVSHNVTVVIRFTEFFIVFRGNGLSSGTLWSVTLTPWGSTDSTTKTGRGSAIGFHEPGGLYNYSFGRVSGYVSRAPGTIFVTGTPWYVYADFVPATYVVTFTESGLPPGTEWSVSIHSQTHSSTSVSMTFQLPNGTYRNFVIHAVRGYTATASPRPLQVDSGPATVSVTFEARHTGEPKELTPGSPSPALGLPVVQRRLG